jgi:PAS domain S-box-containing protein
MTAPEPAGRRMPKAPSDDDLVDQALRQATDATSDARAVFAAVRDEAGGLVDLRIVYGNAAYGAMSGLDPGTALGRRITETAPDLDWTEGLAAELFAAVASRQGFADRMIRLRPQLGRRGGQERVFEVQLTVADDVLAAGFRDITADVDAAERQASEARRRAALVRFLGTAVDPLIGRTELMNTLATDLAATIGNLCVIIEQAPDGALRMVGVAGGPGDTAARIREVVADRPIPIPEIARAAFLEAATVMLSPIPPEIREAMVGSFETLGLPDDLALTVNSVIAAGIRSGTEPIGRIHVLRFGDDAPFTGEDRAMVESIASAAALVFERHAVEGDLAASLARFEALIEQVPISMVVVASDRSIRLNAAAVELYGRSREEMAELAFRPDAPWIPSDQVELWAEMRRQVAAGERVIGVRCALIRPDGERREIEGSAIPILTRDGRPAGVVTLHTDLTERLSLESQLRQAQKMEALGRMAGGVAHDFNNVLMAILGYAEFVARDARESQVDPEHADQVVEATRRAIELTGRLTAFARREVARLESVEVSEAVLRALPLIRQLIPESIELETHLEPGPAALLDRVEFEQVLMNLAVNAVDAMPDGGRLTIETDVVDLDVEHAATHLGVTAGRRILVAVSDTGIGMDDATRARIFEPFFTTKPVGEGTGLGLAMVFGAIERAHGSIWVYSEPGRGSTFKLYLPPAEPGVPLVSGERGMDEAVVGGSESILLLEDEELVRDFAATVLQGQGYDVTVAGRPSEALAIANSRSFDLLISDVVMPEMTGDLVAARLRDTQPDLRVVFMSGYTARVLGFTLGPLDSLVHKPVTQVELARIVREALDRSID